MGSGPQAWQGLILSPSQRMCSVRPPASSAPAETARVSYVESCLKERKGPVIAATDYVSTYAEQIRPFVPRRYCVLGTDGYGRSDTRTKLREFFEVNAQYIAVAALKALADDGKIPTSKVTQAIKKYAIDPDKPNPAKV